MGNRVHAKDGRRGHIDRSIGLQRLGKSKDRENREMDKNTCFPDLWEKMLNPGKFCLIRLTRNQRLIHLCYRGSRRDGNEALERLVDLQVHLRLARDECAPTVATA